MKNKKGMDKRRVNKKGQFYIVAAIIIVLALSGIASTTTYAVVKPEPRTIQSLSSELKEESSRIIDYGVYNKEDLYGENGLLDRFIGGESGFAPYFLKKTDEANILFIYGDNEGDLNAYRYREDKAGQITLSLGSGGLNWDIEQEVVESVPVDVEEGEVTIRILNEDFKFKIRDNEIFYFVIVQDRAGEIYVERN